MRYVFLTLLICLTFSLRAFAYPENQLDECILSARQSPIILGAPKKSLENFCDCSLKLILDKGNDEMISINKCASKYFG